MLYRKIIVAVVIIKDKYIYNILLSMDVHPWSIFHVFGFIVSMHSTADMRGEYGVLVRRPERRRPLGRPRRRSEDNFKMDIKEVEWGGMNWIDLGQDRDRWRVLANAVMKLCVSYRAGNLLSSWGPDKFFRKDSSHWNLVLYFHISTFGRWILQPL